MQFFNFRLFVTGAGLIGARLVNPSLSLKGGAIPAITAHKSVWNALLFPSAMLSGRKD